MDVVAKEIELCGLLRKFAYEIRNGIDNGSKAQDKREAKAIKDIFKFALGWKPKDKEIQSCLPW